MSQEVMNTGIMIAADFRILESEKEGRK